MNREIKFRAWDGLEMLEDWLVLSESNSTIIPTTLSRKAVVVMQYTGLKDKNGKEIYEGDIFECLENNYYKGRATVIFNTEKARFELNKSIGCNHKDLPDNLNRGFVVVGNIYENPELKS